MDGDVKTADIGIAAQRRVHVAPSRAKQVRWFAIVGVLLALVLGGIWGFNTFRDHAIANFFANNKPPPAQIAAVKATTESVPRFANGIGSLAAVHQVTVNPEVGGRVVAITFEAGATVKAGDKLLQIDDGPDRGDLANFDAQKRWAAVSLQRAQTLSARQFASLESVDQTQSQLDQANAQIQKTQAIIAQKQIRAPFAGRLGMRQVELGQYLQPGAPIVTLTDLSMLYVNFTLPSQLRSAIKLGQSVNVTVDAFPGRKFTAQISTIEPQIRADTRTMMVQATLANADEALLPGMFVDAQVVLPEEADQVVLPGDRGRLHALRRQRLPDPPGRHRRQRQAGAKGGPYSGQDRPALGEQGGDPLGAEARGRGRRRRTGQGAGRRCGRRHRQPAAASAGPVDPAVMRPVRPSPASRQRRSAPSPVSREREGPTRSVGG